MKKVLPIVIVVLVIAAGLVYWLTTKDSDSSSNNQTSSSSSADHPENMPSESSNATDTAPQATDKVTIKDFAFTPANITVKKGTTVTWTNQDGTPHTVTGTDSQDGPNSGSLENGKSYTFTFDTVGTFNYKCTFHPEMTGTVTVTE